METRNVINHFTAMDFEIKDESYQRWKHYGANFFVKNKEIKKIKSAIIIALAILCEES